MEREYQRSSLDKAVRRRERLATALYVFGVAEGEEVQRPRRMNQTMKIK